MAWMDLTLVGNYHHVPVQRIGGTDIYLRCHFCGAKGPIGKDDESLVRHDTDCYIKTQETK